MRPAKGTSSVRKHEQQSQERKMMQNKLPKTETNKKLPKMKHKQTKTNKQIDLNDCTTHTKPLNRYNTEEETKLTHNSQ